MFQNLTTIDTVKDVPAGYEKVAVKIGRLTIMVVRPISHIITESELNTEVNND